MVVLKRRGTQTLRSQKSIPYVGVRSSGCNKVTMILAYAVLFSTFPCPHHPLWPRNPIAIPSVQDCPSAKGISESPRISFSTSLSTVFFVDRYHFGSLFSLSLPLTSTTIYYYNCFSGCFDMTSERIFGIGSGTRSRRGC